MRFLLQRLACTQVTVRRGQRLAEQADVGDLFQYTQHVRLALQVMAAVAQIERLVDQRKIRNDVADHRMFECGPVVPRRIVRVATRDPVAGRGRQCDEYGTTPAFDKSIAARAVAGVAD